MFFFQFQACGYPVYWKGVVFVAAGGEKAESLTFTMFAEFWRRLMNSHHDEASQFVFVLAKGNSAKRYQLSTRRLYRKVELFW